MDNYTENKLDDNARDYDEAPLQVMTLQRAQVLVDAHADGRLMSDELLARARAYIPQPVNKYERDAINAMMGVWDEHHDILNEDAYYEEMMNGQQREEDSRQAMEEFERQEQMAADWNARMRGNR